MKLILIPIIVAITSCAFHVETPYGDASGKDGKVIVYPKPIILSGSK